MNDEILDFIHRRFPEDSHWTDGNCYYFALILADRFHGNIYYDSINGHFMVWLQKEGCYVDHTGYIRPPYEECLKLWKDLRYNDPPHYERIMRDCIM